MPGLECHETVSRGSPMSVAKPTNIPASVKQRLLNLSRQSDIEFNVILTKYVLERLLYRISISRLRERFILKGAILFSIWTQTMHRTTRDVDFLDLESTSLERLNFEFREICELKTEDDGVQFLPESVRATEIRGHDTFEGARINLTGMLGKANIPLQVDIGLGDSCVPAAEFVDFPVLLDYPVPRLKASAQETMIAEKFHAIVGLGMRNSRMKDYFDIYYLSREFNFIGKELCQAFKATFERQTTALPQQAPIGLSREFSLDSIKEIQWKSFLVQKNVSGFEKKFEQVVAAVREFLMPPSSASAKRLDFDESWSAGGPWRKKGGSDGSL